MNIRNLTFSYNCLIYIYIYIYKRYKVEKKKYKFSIYFIFFKKNEKLISNVQLNNI